MSTLRGLNVEIGTQRYELPEMSEVMTGKDLKEIIHFITQCKVDVLYINS